MKENQREILYWNLHRFGQGRNKKYYNPARMLLHYYKHVCSFQRVRTINLT
jgi:hypothetical protein